MDSNKPHTTQIHISLFTHFLQFTTLHQLTFLKMFLLTHCCPSSFFLRGQFGALTKSAILNQSKLLLIVVVSVGCEVHINTCNMLHFSAIIQYSICFYYTPIHYGHAQMLQRIALTPNSFLNISVENHLLTLSRI